MRRIKKLQELFKMNKENFLVRTPFIYKKKLILLILKIKKKTLIEIVKLIN